MTDMPVYQRVAETLKKNIAENCYQSEFLPSENHLAALFSVNRHTIRRAVDELISAGLVVRKQGKGSRIINTGIDYSLTEGRFTDTLDKLKRKSKSQLLRAESKIANSAIAEYLKIEEGKPIVLLTTLRFLDDSPISLIRHYLNPDYVPDIEKQYTSGSLHQCIEQYYGIQLLRSEALISAVMPTREEAYQLRSSLSRPLIKIKSFNVVKESPEKIVEVSISSSRSDRFQVKVPFFSES